MLKQMCCEIYPPLDVLTFDNMIVTNISKAMALKEEEGKILSPFLENMMNFEADLKKVSTLNDEEEAIEKLISELTNIEVTLSLIDSEMSEIEMEFVGKKNEFDLEFTSIWDKLLPIKIKIEKNTKFVQMHKELANSIQSSLVTKQMKAASHLREDYLNILKEMKRRQAFQVEFLKKLDEIDLNTIINEENEKRSNIKENRFLPHDSITGFQNKLPILDYSKFNVDNELPTSIDLENDNWMVFPITDSILEQKPVKNISDSFEISGSFSGFGSELIENTSSIEVPANVTSELLPITSIVEVAPIQPEDNSLTVDEETKSEDEILEKLTPSPREVPDIQQLQIDELLKKNQELEENNHILEKNNQKSMKKISKLETELEELTKNLKSQVRINSILETELLGKSTLAESISKELEKEKNENLELKEKLEKNSQTILDLKKKFESSEKIRQDVVKVNLDQASKIKSLEEQVATLKSQEIQKITQEDLNKLTEKYEKQIVQLNEQHDAERERFGIELSEQEVQMKKMKNECEFIKNKLQATTKDFVDEIQNFDDYKKHAEQMKKEMEADITEKKRKIEQLHAFIARITDMLANKNK